MLTRYGFLNHCPMKPAVVCQPKFGMFTFVFSHIMCLIVFFFFNWGRKQDYWIFVGGTQKTGWKWGFQNRMKLWCRGKDVLINKVFDSTYKDETKKTRKLSLLLQILWNFVRQNIPLRDQRIVAKNNLEVEKSDLTNSGYLVELL